MSWNQKTQLRSGPNCYQEKNIEKCTPKIKKYKWLNKQKIIYEMSRQNHYERNSALWMGLDVKLFWAILVRA